LSVLGYPSTKASGASGLRRFPPPAPFLVDRAPESVSGDRWNPRREGERMSPLVVLLRDISASSKMPEKKNPFSS